MGRVRPLYPDRSAASFRAWLKTLSVRPGRITWPDSRNLGEALAWIPMRKKKPNKIAHKQNDASIRAMLVF